MICHGYEERQRGKKRLSDCVVAPIGVKSCSYNIIRRNNGHQDVDEFLSVQSRTYRGYLWPLHCTEMGYSGRLMTVTYITAL